MFGIDLPPCLMKVLKDKSLLRKYAKDLLRFINQNKPEALSTFIKHLLNEGIDLKLDMDIYDPFDCNNLLELCSKDCMFYQDIFAWLKSKTSEVLITSDEDSNTILYVKLNDGKMLKLNLNTDNVARSFVSQIAILYKRYVDFDLRRKKDRQQWKDLMEFWVSKAKEVDLAEIEEEDEYIKNIALDFLYNISVRPIDSWKGDTNSAVSRDGIYAYYLKDELRKYVSMRINRRISFKKLTSLLRPEVEPVWVSIDGTRYAFYKFRMTDKQREEYRKYLKILEKEGEVAETKSEAQPSNVVSSSNDSWDIEDVLGV